MKLRNRLHEILKESGTSERALAQRIGVRVATINDIVNGKSPGSLETWEKIINNFGFTSPEHIFYIEQDELTQDDQNA